MLMKLRMSLKFDSKCLNILWISTCGYNLNHLGTCVHEDILDIVILLQYYNIHPHIPLDFQQYLDKKIQLDIFYIQLTLSH